MKIYRIEKESPDYQIFRQTELGRMENPITGTILITEEQRLIVHLLKSHADLNNRLKALEAAAKKAEAP